MDATIDTEITQLFHLVQALGDELSHLVFPAGIDTLEASLRNLSPEGFTRLFDTRLPQNIHQAAGTLILTILLDTSYLQRYGLIHSLWKLPASTYLPALLIATQKDNIPLQVRRLGQIAAQQVPLPGCKTYACVLRNALISRNLMYSITGYAG
jgi:hypothetical protein